MDGFEDALKNIDIFCKVLVKKIVESENEAGKKIIVEPIDKIFRKKYILEDDLGTKSLGEKLINVSQVAEPLIDVIEDNNYVRVIIESHCKDKKVTIQKKSDILEISMEDELKKLKLPHKHLQIENIKTRCNNNVFEIRIPKVKELLVHNN